MLMAYAQCSLTRMLILRRQRKLLLIQRYVCSHGLCLLHSKQKNDANFATPKTNYPAACNSAETLLVHHDLLASGKFVTVATALLQAGVSLRCDAVTYDALANSQALDSKWKEQISRSTDEDYDTEFLELTIAVKVVQNVSEAVDHIIEHGSKHTDCIITEDAAVAEFFMARVDAAGCYWNASTRFADGFRYGFGAEVGVRQNVNVTDAISCLN
jgi:glutamate-5-semialdehyde dehydrogenase